MVLRLEVACKGETAQPPPTYFGDAMQMGEFDETAPSVKLLAWPQRAKYCLKFDDEWVSLLKLSISQAPI